MKGIVTLCLLVNFGFAAFGSSGFSSDVEKTFLAAKKEKKPILISFYGIWCPPCNELEETVFESTGFLNKARAFKLLKVDADQQAAWQIKSRYKVGGYPTVVFTTPTGDELYRIVGYRTAKEFVRVMDLVLGAKGKDLSKACNSKSADDLWRCALVCAERKESQCAQTAFRKLETKLKPGTARHDEAKSYFVDNAATDESKRDGYARLMAESSDSPRALVWALEYVKLFAEGANPGPKGELLEKVLSQFSKMEADPRAEELGIPKTDMVQIRAMILAKLGKVEEAKKAWKDAAVLLEKLAGELAPGAPARGFTIERISCLEEAGMNEEALKLAQEYRTRFPDEFTFHYWAASLLDREKKFNEALPIGKKAYEVSYGDNRIRAATLLIRLYSTVPDKASAKKVYEEVTRDIKPDSALEIRTHRYLKKLDEAWAALSA